FRKGDSPILHLARPEGITEKEQRAQLDLLRSLNGDLSERYPGDTELVARAKRYDLAYRMQASAPEAVDFAKETEATKKAYGIGTK
ncbi:DUF1501 domain-containing protein, partial [Serratia marcescens]|uniref:DUF1501 domain-containing protein n=1 Tax=Serratia marcescens TaxID=615 RepID=UPI0013DCDB4F